MDWESPRAPIQAQPFAVKFKPRGLAVALNSLFYLPHLFSCTNCHLLWLINYCSSNQLASLTSIPTFSISENYQPASTADPSPLQCPPSDITNIPAFLLSPPKSLAHKEQMPARLGSYCCPLLATGLKLREQNQVPRITQKKKKKTEEEALISLSFPVKLKQTWLTATA